MPINDPFAANPDAADGPSTNPYPVVPSDTAQLAPVPKALWIGVAGDVTLRGVHGNADVTFLAVMAGTVLDVRALYVRQAGTTASGIVALA